MKFEIDYDLFEDIPEISSHRILNIGAIEDLKDLSLEEIDDQINLSNE